MKLRGYSGMAAATAMLIGLAACSSETETGDETAQSGSVSDQTLAESIANYGDLSSVATVLGDAGLAQVFDGAASYTVLAPTDAAFDKLGEASSDLRAPEQRPAMVAILRDHIVPGYLTPDDIRNAITASDESSVTMKTMGGHLLTFTAQGDAITVKSEDGATALLAGDALRATNGVAIPIDGLLKATTAPAAT